MAELLSSVRLRNYTQLIEAGLVDPLSPKLRSFYAMYPAEARSSAEMQIAFEDVKAAQREGDLQTTPQGLFFGIFASGGARNLFVRYIEVATSSQKYRPMVVFEDAHEQVSGVGAGVEVSRGLSGRVALKASEVRARLNMKAVSTEPVPHLAPLTVPAYPEHDPVVARLLREARKYVRSTTRARS
jgi:hypothetical protein